MLRHPTVQVPNIGPMDHAWDLLGEWQAEFELAGNRIAGPWQGDVPVLDRRGADARSDRGGDCRDSVDRSAGAGERDPSDRCGRRRAPVGAARPLDQLVAPGHDVARLAPSVRERCRRRRRTTLSARAPCERRSTICRSTRWTRSEPSGPSSCTVQRLRHSARARAGGGGRAHHGGAAETRGGGVRRVRRRRRRSPCPFPSSISCWCRGGLLLAVTLGLWRLREGEIFRAVDGRCPFCGTEQSFPVMGRFRLPRELDCATVIAG